MYSITSKILLSIVITISLFSGCSNDGSGGSSDDGSKTSLETSLSGVAQKGAFLEGSTVSLCKLDKKMVCTDQKVEVKVTDNKGSYKFNTLSWSGLSRLSISGKYFDEVTGTTSLSAATITAIVDIKPKTRIKNNINLLTDMQAKRMKELVEKGKALLDASNVSKEDVKKLFNIHSDDFSALNLVDFSKGKASVNVELLRISTAAAKAEDPIATLDELMKIYNEYGLEGVLNSKLYKELMGLIKDVDVKKVVTKMLNAEVADTIGDVVFSPFAIANVVTYGNVESNSKVRISLIGTKFTDTPSINVNSTNNILSIESMQVMDDNKSVVLQMNKETSCEDINSTFTLDYMSLEGVESPIKTSTLRYMNDSSFCTVSAIDNENTTPVNQIKMAMLTLVPLENNKIEVALVGTQFENYTNLNAELITSSDTLAIVDTHVSDNNKSVIFTLNEDTDFCAENNITIGLYTNNLKDVPNESDTFKSNQIKYVSPNMVTVCDNSNNIPVPVSINLTDINISIVVKGDKATQTYFNSAVTPSEYESPQHGTVEYYMIGNEVPAFKYTSTDCFTGIDSFVYKVGNDYGRVNVTINEPNYDHADDFNVTLFNDKVINSTYLTDNKSAQIVSDTSHGRASIFIVANEFVHFAYDPDDNFVGRDFFEYTISNNINECAYTDKGRVNFTVEQEPQPVNHAPTVSISPNTNKTINIGNSVTLASIASDVDGDDINITWKLKKSSETNFTEVANFGITGFRYTFNEAGTYLVVVEAKDPSGAKASANITVNVSASAVVNLADIDISVVVKGDKSSQAYFNSAVTPIAEVNPQHGTVVYNMIGNEDPAFTYTSTDCFTGTDSFVYKVGNDYGRVNVTIHEPNYDHADDFNVTLFNDKVINSTYLTDNKSAQIVSDTSHGTASIFIVANEFVHFAYDPDDDFVGSDFFEYTISNTIDECNYNDIGRVNFTVLGPLHLFSWNDGVHGIELWRTDGTASGTTMVKDIMPGDQYSYSQATPGVKINGINYFAANDGNHSTELWRTDGTEAGTYMVKDINPGLNDTSYPYDLSVIGDKLYFFALSGDNNGSNYKGNKGIWVSDGTSNGTHLVEALGDYSKNSYSYPGYLHALGNKLLFAKDDAAGGGSQWEPWVSDGINSSAKLKDIWQGDGGSSFIACVEMNNKCYGKADDYTHGAELWATDGTSGGTYMVRDINENNSTTTRTKGSVPTDITLVGDRLFFIAFDTVQGISLFKSDGTKNGTVLVKDSFADENETDAMKRYDYRYNYRYLTAVGNTLYFSLDDGINGQDIFKSDGTQAGTLRVANFSDTASPASLTQFNGTLYFWLYNSDTPDNTGLYKLDESTSSVTLIKSFSYDNFALSNSEKITVDGDKLYFEVLDYANNNTSEYWVSDGTQDGTFKLVDGESHGGGGY